MKTAEEYYMQARNFFFEIPNSTEVDIVELAINEARIDCIEECAEAARTRTNDESTSIIVDKQSILKLKERLK